jgi:hypothetical protein
VEIGDFCICSHSWIDVVGSSSDACKLQIVTLEAWNQVFRLCFVHNCPSYARLSGVITIVGVWPFSSTLHYFVTSDLPSPCASIYKFKLTFVGWNLLPIENGIALRAVSHDHVSTVAVISYWFVSWIESGWPTPASSVPCYLCYKCELKLKNKTFNTKVTG